MRRQDGLFYWAIVTFLTVILALLLFVLWASPAQAHSDEEMKAWELDWAERASEGLTVELVEERRDMAERHLPAVTEAPGGSSGASLGLAHYGSGMGTGSTDWTGLLRAYFPESEIATAQRIVNCESGGNPSARNSSSGAAGLFQVMPFWASHYGRSYEDLFDPSINTEIAYRIWSEEGGWRHWVCW